MIVGMIYLFQLITLLLSLLPFKIQLLTVVIKSWNMAALRPHPNASIANTTDLDLPEYGRIDCH